MTTPEVRTRKKLIEVALPLDAINAASAREKSIRHGHPSTLHLWWARRPLASARAVIFAQMVDDPAEYADELLSDASLRELAERELAKRLELWERRTTETGSDTEHLDSAFGSVGPAPTLKECAADLERERLFRMIEELVRWESTGNEKVLEPAREEIRKSWRRTCQDNANHPQAAELFNPNELPAFHDPFAGGGALPLEAQRLGLRSHASDLNPVAVLLNKSMIEIPPKFASRPPVNPEVRNNQAMFQRQWTGAEGLAEDVRYYGQWMRDEAEKRIGHLYPKVNVTPVLVRERPDLKSYEGQALTVIAWLWARTVKSPNPAFAHVDVPLVTNFMLSAKKGRESYIQPIVDGDQYEFAVNYGTPVDLDQAKLGTSAGKRRAFRCLLSDTPITYEYIRSEAQAGRMGARLMAIVVEGDRERIYLAPDSEAETIARTATPDWQPETPLPNNPRDFKTPNYGLNSYGDLFTDRQLVALTTFSDLVQEVQERAKHDAIAAGLTDDVSGLEAGGNGATAYAEGLSIYLSLVVSKCADYWSSISTWDSSRDGIRNTFGRQAIPMSWDYAEGNPFSSSTGNWTAMSDWTRKALAAMPARGHGVGSLADAQNQTISKSKIVSTDPPYYDNIGYADLSDFFYVWLRRSLRSVLPNLFGTLAVPKIEELVATPYRHGGKEKAEAFFLLGMTEAMHQLTKQSNPSAPVTIYYAFKQAETRETEGTSSTGWETFLEAVIRAGFGISGTWPMRTELAHRMISSGTNALASSIVLVCRPRSQDAAVATRREFLTQLQADLPKALLQLQRGNIAPVDLAQAAIGPGMALYTSYSRVIDAQGDRLSVREALTLINQVLDEVLAEQEGDFDSETRWALAWFEHVAYDEGEYGLADTLSKAKNTSVGGMVTAGLVKSTAGKVRLLRAKELPSDWDPTTDDRLTVWEAVHHLIRVHEAEGEQAAAQLAAKLGALADVARELAYRLFNISDRKGWAQEALSFNALVQSWPEIQQLARQQSSRHNEAVSLF